MGPGCGLPLSGPRQPKHPLSWLRLLHTSTRSLHQQSQRQTRLREGCRLTQHRMETQSEPSQLPSPAHSTFTPLRGPNIELRGSRFLPRRLSGDPLHSPLCSGSLSENGISWRHCTQPEGCAGLSQHRAFPSPPVLKTQKQNSSSKPTPQRMNQGLES